MNMVADSPRILRPGGEFRFVTDIADYAAWTLQRLLAIARFRVDGAMRRRLAQALARLHATRYHAKAAREDRASCFLIFRRR